MRVLFFNSLLAFLLAGRMFAQVSFEAAEPYLLQSNVQGYLSPAVDALSATMHSSSIDYFYPDLCRCLCGNGLHSKFYEDFRRHHHKSF
jgi:hypothetical protein